MIAVTRFSNSADDRSVNVQLIPPSSPLCSVVSLHTVLKMYVEYKNVPVHKVQGCTQSMGNVHRVQNCINLYAKYELSMSYDTDSPQPGDDLYDTESLQPYTCNPVTVYIVLVELIIPVRLENLHSTTATNEMHTV